MSLEMHIQRPSRGLPIRNKDRWVGEKEHKCSIALRPILTFINSDDLCCSNLDFTFLIYTTGIN